MPNSHKTNFQAPSTMRQPMIVKTKLRQTFNNTAVVSPKPLLKTATYGGLRSESPCLNSPPGTTQTTNQSAHISIVQPLQLFSQQQKQQSPRQPPKKKRFTGNFVFRKKERDITLNPRRKKAKQSSSTNMHDEVASEGAGALAQSAISARVTEARYDENRLQQILQEDFVCLLDGSNVFSTHDDEAVAPSAFRLRNFDKPMMPYDEHSSLGMVKLDPQYSAQAQIQRTLANHTSSVLRHIGGEKQYTASDLHKQIEAENELAKAENEHKRIHELNLNKERQLGNLSHISTIKFWNFSSLGPTSPPMLSPQAAIEVDKNDAGKAGVVYAPRQLFSPGIRSKSANRVMGLSQRGKSVQDMIRENSSSAGFMSKRTVQKKHQRLPTAHPQASNRLMQTERTASTNVTNAKRTHQAKESKRELHRKVLGDKYLTNLAASKPASQIRIKTLIDQKCMERERHSPMTATLKGKQIETQILTQESLHTHTGARESGQVSQDWHLVDKYSPNGERDKSQNSSHQSRRNEEVPMMRSKLSHVGDDSALTVGAPEQQNVNTGPAQGANNLQFSFQQHSKRRNSDLRDHLPAEKSMNSSVYKAEAVKSKIYEPNKDLIASNGQVFGGSIRNVMLLSEVARRSNPLKSQLENCKRERVDSTQTFQKGDVVNSSIGVMVSGNARDSTIAISSPHSCETASFENIFKIGDGSANRQTNERPILQTIPLVAFESTGSLSDSGERRDDQVTLFDTMGAVREEFLTQRSATMAQLVPILKQRLSEISPSDQDSVLRLQEDMDLMEIMRTTTFDDEQIRQLAQHLLAEDNLSHAQFARLATQKRLIQVDNQVGAATRSEAGKKRLMLERYRQLLDAQDPKAVVKQGNRKLKPRSIGRFKIYMSRDKHQQSQKQWATTQPPVAIFNIQEQNKSTSSDELDLRVEKVKLRNFKSSFVRVAQNLHKKVQTMKQQMEKQDKPRPFVPVPGKKIRIALRAHSSIYRKQAGANDMNSAESLYKNTISPMMLVKPQLDDRRNSTQMTVRPGSTVVNPLQQQYSSFSRARNIDKNSECNHN